MSEPDKAFYSAWWGWILWELLIRPYWPWDCRGRHREGRRRKGH